MGTEQKEPCGCEDKDKMPESIRVGDIKCEEEKPANRENTKKDADATLDK